MERPAINKNPEFIGIPTTKKQLSDFGRKHMGERAEYRSAVRSRELIRKAYMQLMQEKDSSKITVTDIIRAANINRSTFYAHYPDVKGLVGKIEDEIIEKMLESVAEFDLQTFHEHPEPILQKMTEFLKDDEEFYRALIKSKGAESFLAKIKALFTEKILNNESVPQEIRESTSFQVRVCYFAGGISNLYQQWFLGNLPCTLDDIPLEIGKMVQAAANAK